MGNKGLSSYSLSSSLDESKKAALDSKEGSTIHILTGGTVTATTKRKKFSSSFFLEKVSGPLHSIFPDNGKVNAGQSKMKTSIAEHLEQQQQTR